METFILFLRYGKWCILLKTYSTIPTAQDTRGRLRRGVRTPGSGRVVQESWAPECERACPGLVSLGLWGLCPAVIRGKPSIKRMLPSTRQAPAKLPKCHVKHQSPTAVLVTPDATSKRLCPKLFLTWARISEWETLALFSYARTPVEQAKGPLCNVDVTHTSVTAADHREERYGCWHESPLFLGFLS